MWIWLGVGFGVFAAGPIVALLVLDGVLELIDLRQRRRGADEFAVVADGLADVAAAGRRIAAADLYLVPVSPHREES